MPVYKPEDVICFAELEVKGEKRAFPVTENSKVSVNYSDGTKVEFGVAPKLSLSELTFYKHLSMSLQDTFEIDGLLFPLKRLNFLEKESVTCVTELGYPVHPLTEVGLSGTKLSLVLGYVSEDVLLSKLETHSIDKLTFESKTIRPKALLSGSWSYLGAMVDWSGSYTSAVSYCMHSVHADFCADESGLVPKVIDLKEFLKGLNDNRQLSNTFELETKVGGRTVQKAVYSLTDGVSTVQEVAPINESAWGVFPRVTAPMGIFLSYAVYGAIGTFSGSRPLVLESIILGLCVSICLARFTLDALYTAFLPAQHQSLSEPNTSPWKHWVSADLYQKSIRGSLLTFEDLFRYHFYRWDGDSPYLPFDFTLFVLFATNFGLSVNLFAILVLVLIVYLGVDYLFDGSESFRKSSTLIGNPLVRYDLVKTYLGSGVGYKPKGFALMYLGVLRPVVYLVVIVISIRPVGKFPYMFEGIVDAFAQILGL